MSSGKLKILRIAVTALSLSACVLLVALRVRSYLGLEIREQRNGFAAIQFSSVNGRIAIGHLDRFSRVKRRIALLQ